HLDLHSFPTRRSSDLAVPAEGGFSGKEGVCFYGLLAVLAFNILLTAAAEPQRFTSVLAVKELSDGTAEKFAAAAWDNIQILKERDRKSTRLNSSHVSI